MYRISSLDTKIQSLIQSPKNIFTTSDLALLWGFSNKNTLWKTISRYVKKGFLIRIYKGLYSKIPLKSLSVEELGCALMESFSYISLETVLSREGIIMQEVHAITLVGRNSGEKIINGIRFTCKQMKEEFLLNREGIVDNANYSIATPQRALADLQYFKKNYYIDNPNSIDALLVKEVQKEVGYK